MLLGFIDESDNLGTLVKEDLIRKIRRELQENCKEKENKKELRNEPIEKIIDEIDSVEKRVLESENHYTKVNANVNYFMPLYCRQRPVLTLLTWSALDSCLSSELKEAYKQVKEIEDLEQDSRSFHQKIKNFMSYTSDSLGSNDMVFRGAHRPFALEAAHSFFEDTFSENLRLAVNLKNKKWDNQILYDTYVSSKRPGRVYYQNCIDLLYQILQQVNNGSKKLAKQDLINLYDHLDHPLILNEIRKTRIKDNVEKVHLNDPAIEYVKIRGLLAYLKLIRKS